MKLRTTELLDDMVSDIGELENLVRELESKEDEIRYKNRALKELTRDNAELSNMATNRFVDNNTDQIIEILIDEVQRATTTSSEFDYPPFAENLIDSIKANRPISIDYKRGRISVIIDMDNAAGTLEDYANAITLARAILREEAEERNISGRRVKYDPYKASNYWAYHIWNKRAERPEYEYTMSLRFENFSTMAPYWELIDKGVPQPLKSNKGGFPTPTDPPSRFVSLAKERIHTFSTSNIDGYKQNIINETNDNIDYNNEYLSDIISDINILLDMIEELNSEEFKVAKNQIEDRYEEKLPSADPAKIRDLARKLAEGEEIPDRIRVGGGIRIRTITLERQIQEELRRIQSE